MYSVLSVLVENESGVLTRIAGLFSRRGFNIESLTVGPTEIPQFARMTITVNASNAVRPSGVEVVRIVRGASVRRIASFKSISSGSLATATRRKPWDK